MTGVESDFEAESLTPVQGKEYSFSESAEWGYIRPDVGQVLEFNLRASSLMVFDDIWAALLIKEKQVGPDLHYVLVGDLLGVEDFDHREMALGELSTHNLSVHLCAEAICEHEGAAEVHCQRIRVWDVDKFKADYLSAGGKKLLGETLKKKAAPIKAAKAKTDAKKRATKPKNAGKDEAPKASTSKRKPKPGEEDLGGEEDGRGHESGKRDMLRDRLASLRARVHGKTSTSGGGKKANDSAPAQANWDLVSGLHLDPGNPAMPIGDGVEEPRGGTMMTSKKTSISKGKSPPSLLLARAVQQEERRVREQKRKEGRTSSTQKLAKVLAQALSGRRSRRKKAKREARKKRKREEGDREGGDGGDSGDGSESSDSKDGSCSESPSRGGGSGSGHETDESRSYEPPLKKKSAERPGSVTELLVKQAAHHLDQAAILDDRILGYRRCEDSLILLPDDSAIPCLNTSDGSRVVFLEPSDRSVEGRKAESSCRRLSGQVYRRSPGLGRRELGISIRAGDVLAGGCFLRPYRNAAQGSATQEAGREVSRLGSRKRKRTELQGQLPVEHLPRRSSRRRRQGEVEERKGSERKNESEGKVLKLREEQRVERQQGREETPRRHGLGDANLDTACGGQAAPSLVVPLPAIFGSLAAECRSLRAAGCMLAWFFFNRLWHITEGEEWLGYQRRFGTAVRRGLAKPLEKLQGHFRGRPLSELSDDVLHDKYGEDAWVLCSLLMVKGLNGPSSPMEAGRWTRLQVRGAEEIRFSVQRLLILDETCPRSYEVIEKEMSERFLTYTGKR